MIRGAEITLVAILAALATAVTLTGCKNAVGAEAAAVSPAPPVQVAQAPAAPGRGPAPAQPALPPAGEQTPSPAAAVAAHADLGWGLVEWVPIPERMRGPEIADIFAKVSVATVGPSTSPYAPQTAQLDQIARDHADDSDVQVLVRYIRAICYGAFVGRRLPGPDEVTATRQAAGELRNLARQDPSRYAYFDECAAQFLASCDMLDPPRSAEHAKAVLTTSLKDSARTQAVRFSLEMASRMVAQERGEQAALSCLQEVAGTWPGTLAAFNCWVIRGHIHMRARDWAAAQEDAARGVEEARRVGDPRLLACAEGVPETVRALEARANAAKAKGGQ